MFRRQSKPQDNPIRAGAFNPPFFDGFRRSIALECPSTMTPRIAFSLVATMALNFSLPAVAAPTITIQTGHPGAKINPAMWGVFFEDINFGADGGIYAEMVKNRGFEFPEPLMGWTKLSPPQARGELSVRDAEPFNPNVKAQKA